jgi:signal transduction histidine kinase
VNEEDLNLLNNFTLLYVEDDKDTSELISSILEDYTKELYIAYNGEEGLELYKEYKPDIVLSDIQMPIMNGITMAQEIKKIQTHQPIALFTAFNDPEYLKQAVNLGISKYVLKPLNEEQFFDALISMAKVLQADVDRENLRRMLETQSKVASMGEMIGNIAHQWRQPLSMISSTASSIKISKMIGEITEEEEMHQLDKIIEHTKFLSQTIEDFRDFLKDNTLSKSQFDLQETLTKVIYLTSDAFKSNHITVNHNIPKLTLYQNKNKLIQALINIFNNTKDAFEQNNIENRYFFIDISVENDEVIMCFKDSAGGIKKDVIDKIFEPYFTTKHQYSGTGIGLYMTYQIIVHHFAGSIEVKNRSYEYEGSKLEGAEFIIKLPITHM